MYKADNRIPTYMLWCPLVFVFIYRESKPSLKTDEIYITKHTHVLSTEHNILIRVQIRWVYPMYTLN